MISHLIDYLQTAIMISLSKFCSEISEFSFLNVTIFLFGFLLEHSNRPATDNYFHYQFIYPIISTIYHLVKCERICKKWSIFTLLLLSSPWSKKESDISEAKYYSQDSRHFHFVLIK